ncbi:hypothetical protein F2Q70_00020463 [Brassica cretica]|uniref:Uncharacterized protein n=1 Tax=Brassica cretica TaxID=69181 RepID=A0A8S9GJD0_BRACR|nr:hypothetical protein F2Q70_00020463 [Brassica cretica]
MAPDACTATPRALHVLQHGQDSCRAPPLLPDVSLHDWNSCKAPQLHVLLPCPATPRASVDTQLAGQLTPRFEHSHQATSCFSVNSLHYNLDGNISRASGFSETYYRIPKLGFRPISGFPVVLRSHRALFPSYLIPVLLNFRPASNAFEIIFR